MLKVCLEMKLLKYGFVGLLLLASALFIVVPTQSQVIFGQGANTTNTTDSETPAFDGQTPGFIPKSEDGAAPPPPPADATTVAELPKETLVKDPDSDALSIGNRTEILEVLPANSTKIIKFVDEDLKNSTGVGLAPTDVLEKLTSNANDNKSILSLATPEEVKEIESVVVNTTSAPSEEDDEVPVANATSEEEDQAAAGEENANATNATDVTGDEQGSTGDQDEQQSQSGEEQQAQTGEEPPLPLITNATNATAAQAAGMLNASNITGIPDEAGSEDDNSGANDGSGDE
jgi:hypothetical protein